MASDRDTRGSDSMRQGASAARKAGKGGARAAKAVGKLIPTRVKIVIAIVLATFLLLAEVIPTAGSSQSSLDATNYLTAEDAEEVNAPETEEEKSSVYSRVQSLDQTLELATLIEEAKREDRERIDGVLQKMYEGKNVTIECDSDTAPTYVCDDVDGYGTPYDKLNSSNVGGSGGGGGEIIAQTAEKMAYPEGTPDSKRDYTKGARGTDAMHKARDKYHPGWSDRKYACCCHGVGLILSEAFGKPIGSLLPNKGKEGAKKDIEKKLKGLDFTVFDYDGNESSLQRGDILSYAKKSGGGHVYIYLGDGKTCEAHHSISYFAAIENKKYSKPKPSSCDYYFVIRKGGSSVGNGGVTSGRKSTSTQDVINGACAWAEAIANNDEFHYGEASWSHHNGCYFCDTNKKLKGSGEDKQKTFCCNPFVHAAFAHGGGDPKMLKRCKKNDAYGTSYSDGWKSDKNWKHLGKISKKKLKKGDVCLTGGHAMLYIGNGKFAHAATSDDGVKGSSSWKDSITVDDGIGYRQVVRYVGKGGGIMEMPEGAGSTPQFTKKDKITVLEEIDKSNGKKKKLKSAGGKVAQSMVVANDKIYVQRINAGASGSGGIIQEYNSSGGHLRDGPYLSQIGHGNGLSYSPKTGKLYSTYAGPGGKLKTVYVIDIDTLSVEDTITLSNGCSGISYDEKTDKWAMNQRSYIQVYDSNLSGRVKTINKKQSGTLVQDCASINGITFAAQTVGSKNWIDLYSIEEGDYLGSYTSNYDEIEGVSFTSDGKMVLVYHVSGNGDNDYIQFTNITVDQSSGNGGYCITEHDMDMLSAYSISLANIALKYDKKGETESFLEGLFSFRYKDMNGRPVKTYWVGEDKGKINYTEDLKAKIESWVFYSPEYTEVTKDGDNVKITLKEVPAHKLCRRMFNLAPYAEYVNAMAAPQSLSEEELKAINDEAKEATSKLDVRDVDKDEWNLILVNNDSALPDGYSPELTEVEGYNVDSRIASDLEQMLEDCRAAGHSPEVISGHRTQEFQEQLYANDPNSGLTAKPGHSEHQTGLAVDILESGYGSDWDDAAKTAETETQKWLTANCKNYGFVLRYPKNKESTTEIGYESWHYRYVGKEHAAKIMENNICLEEYLSGEVLDIIDEEFEEAMKGKTTNAHAIYAISETTAELLFTGMADRQTGDVFGNSDFPIPLDSSWMWSSGVGPRWGCTHEGIDLSVPTGTDIYSTTDGQIISAGPKGAYGNCVCIKTGDKEYRYGHMSKITASPGPVKKGQKIGEVGSTGRSTGSHLHYEVRANGVVIDPFDLFKPEIQQKMLERKDFSL